MTKLLKFAKSLINFCIHENGAIAAFDVNVFEFQAKKKEQCWLNPKKKEEEKEEEGRRRPKKNRRRSVSLEGELMFCVKLGRVKIACKALRKNNKLHAEQSTVYTLHTSLKSIIYIYMFIHRKRCTVFVHFFSLLWDHLYRVCHHLLLFQLDKGFVCLKCT